MAARFILDHDDCGMGCRFPRVSSHADHGGANDPSQVRHDPTTKTILLGLIVLAMPTETSLADVRTGS